MHHCTRCDRNLTIEAFNLRANGKPASYCIECQKRYSAEHYRANSEKHNARRYCNQQKKRKEYQRFIQEAKNKPCTDCGVSYPYYVMQFDHVVMSRSASI